MVNVAWRNEPFRLFFPLGVVLAWVGIGHWLLYAAGVTATYSCQFHGLVQTQAFLMAFAVGFLLTALPRRTQTPPPSALEMGVMAALLTVITGAALAERWALAEISYGLLFALLLQFALRRFLQRSAGRRPPAAFVLLPLGVLHGLSGAALILGATALHLPSWTMGLGKLLVSQGVFLCFAVGVGSLVLPLIGGAPPPADLGSSPRERWKAVAYAAAGLSIFASLLLEQLGWVRSAPVLRAAVVAAGLGLGGGALSAPGKPGFHRRLVWLAAWCMPLGLLVSGLFPDYRVAGLHILFIAGFSLLAFAVATHVAFAHLDLESLAVGRPLAIVVLGASFLLALMARLAADFSDSYFDHLGWAAALWLFGSAVWLGFIGPKLVRPRR